MSVQSVERMEQSASQAAEAAGFAEVLSPSEPGPVQIVAVQSDHSFKLDEEALQEILLSDEVRDKNVVVISVAGAFRKGKSFLLDFLLRFLNNGGLEGSEDWLGEDDTPLTGFSWKVGVDRDTTGILMWSKPFIVTLPDTQEEVAVLLLDTQGAFDNMSTVKDCATIFALSTMISSVQVYNLSMNIQENDLQHLHLFTEYGRLAMEQSQSVQPFQSLCFLVRDWSYPYNHAYGVEGGATFLEKVLKVNEHQHTEIRVVREHIHSCFESLSCFLMPHPGLVVATNPAFDGRLANIDSSFKTCLLDLAPLLLAPDKLIVKKINGTPLTGRGLLECFKVYMKIYQSEDLPTPKSMLEATAEANNLAAQASSLDAYAKRMEALCGVEKPYLAPDKLKESHQEIMRDCLALFKSARKMGGEAFSKVFEERLEAQIIEAYESYEKRNKEKQLLNAYRTPAVLFTVMAVSYFISSILDMLGVESLSQTAIFGLYIPLLVVAVWSYVRYTGEFGEIGAAIDNVTSIVWEQVLQPIYVKILQRSLQSATSLGTKQKRE